MLYQQAGAALLDIAASAIKKAASNPSSKGNCAVTQGE